MRRRPDVFDRLQGGDRPVGHRGRQLPASLGNNVPDGKDPGANGVHQGVGHDVATRPSLAEMTLLKFSAVRGGIRSIIVCLSSIR